MKKFILPILAVFVLLPSVASGSAHSRAISAALTQSQANKIAWDYITETFIPEDVKNKGCIHRHKARGFACSFSAKYGINSELVWNTTLWVWRSNHQIFICEAGIP